MESDNASTIKKYTSRTTVDNVPEFFELFANNDCALPEELSPDTLNGILDYFVISYERQSQMARIYNDIETLTRLLEEKERDLELAARIGQSLLEQNNQLKKRTAELEQEVQQKHEEIERLKFEYTHVSERVTQLKHDLSQKNGLLQIYSADLESCESQCASPDHSNISNTSAKERDKTSLMLSWENLHDKIVALEAENSKLRVEANARVTDIEQIERKELQLIHDCARQLTDANKQLLSLQEELARRSEDNLRQQEEITNLLTQVVDLQRSVRDLTAENQGYESALHVSHECQNELSSELLDLKEKYSTLLGAFHELQEELKKRAKLPVGPWPPSYMPINDVSLAAEIESIAESEGYESEFSSFHRQLQQGESGSNAGTGCPTPELLSVSFPNPSNHHLQHHVKQHRGSLSTTVHSTSTGSRSANSSAGRSLLISDKLKIVKTFEGSETLKMWRKLATPGLGAILENTSGIQPKALKDLNKEIYHYAAYSTQAKTEQAVAATTSAIISLGNATGGYNSYTTTASSCLPTSASLSEPSTLASGNNSPVAQEQQEPEEFEPHPGKPFETSSTFTFTTTCLSQSSDSTKTTPSFSALQLSTGHQTPLSSVMTSTTFSTVARPSITKIALDKSSQLLSVADDKQNLTTPATTPTADAAVTSPSQQSINFANFGSAWASSLGSKCANYVKYWSGYDDSAEPQPKTEETKEAKEVPTASTASSSDVPRDASAGLDSTLPPQQQPTRSPSGSMLNRVGGIGLADLASAGGGSCSIVQRGYDANFDNVKMPMNHHALPHRRPKSLARNDDVATDALSLKHQAGELNCFVGSVSSLKTLRKGGFV